MKKIAIGILFALAILSSCKPDEFKDLESKNGNFHKIEINRTANEFKQD